MTILTLAALDVGSGSIKLDVANVDTRSIPWRIVGELLYSENVELLLGADYKSNPDGKLSNSIMDATVEVISRLQAIAHKHDAKLRGIATAVFRLATNADELLGRINNESGVALEVISQVNDSHDC
jgi:exopolyphosphatase/guanosine-5'-triphosphate,3'-diphosphate pyrophosphatase